MRPSKRPYVICHMVPSIDGRIDPTRWKLPPRALGEYERTAQTFDADAWMIGRISMEPYAGKARLPAQRVPSRSPRSPRRDFVAKSDAGSYAVALDPSGKLRWKSGSIDGEHVVTVLRESVPDSYLEFLRSKGISYVFGGRTEIDLERVLVKLRHQFGIERLLLEGGGKINGSFLAAGLIDELSVLVAPLADGHIGSPSLFDVGTSARPARHLELLSVEKRPGDLVWLRYRLKR